jgi:hypothetical protein
MRSLHRAQVGHDQFATPTYVQIIMYDVMWWMYVLSPQDKRAIDVQQGRILEVN